MEKRVTFLKKFSYGMGDLANNLTWGMAGSFLLYFYTDVFGINAADVAILLLIARILDTFFDPVMGIIVDHTHSKYGKLRPYLLFGAVPLALFLVLTFTTPDFDTTGKLIYAYVTYIMLGFIYSVSNIPFSALPSSMTQDSGERTSLASFKMFGAVTAGLLVGVATLPLVNLLGGGSPQRGFMLISTIFGVITIASLWFTFAVVREHHSLVNEEVTHTPLKRRLGVIFQNRPLIILVIALLIITMIMTIGQSVGIYYARYYLGNENLVSLLALFAIIPMLIGIVLSGSIAKKLNKKRASIAGFVLGIISSALLFWVGRNLVLICILSAINSFAIAVPFTMAWAILADCVEYGQWKTGIRSEGLIYSTWSLTQKLATALAGGLTGAGLSIVGYVANASQTPEVLTGLLFLRAIVPAIGCLIAAVLFIFYNLTEKKMHEILAELDQTRQSAQPQLGLTDAEALHIEPA